MHTNLMTSSSIFHLKFFFLKKQKKKEKKLAIFFGYGVWVPLFALLGYCIYFHKRLGMKLGHQSSLWKRKSKKKRGVGGP
jgi:hypothetical protein